jgi:DNA-binding NtrC family response regulator
MNNMENKFSDDLVMVIDDDEKIRHSLATFLKNRGFQVISAADGDEALIKMEMEQIQIALTDLKMPGLSDMDLVRKMRESNPDTSIICMTGYGSIGKAVEAMKEGAYDFLTKPLDLDELELTLDKASEKQHLIKEVKHLRRELGKKYHFNNIIGKSGKMQGVLHKLAKIADVNTSVLILGESGTGKELIARAIHYNSARKKQPFIPIHCASIPETLMESELFGHEKGSFTGAFQLQEGMFQLAEKGSVFLDDIGEISTTVQVKLLRVLQEREFMRLGGKEIIGLKARIIAATNRDLVEAVKNKTFREDLYYRLNVVPIILPPLRERKEDIPLLAEYFMLKFCQESQKPPLKFSSEAMNLLIGYSWPGNVRELENSIESAVVMTESDTLTTKNLPLPLRLKPSELEGQPPLSNYSLTQNIESLEKYLILNALKETNGNRTRAAQLLGVTYRCLRYKVKKYGMEAKIVHAD